MLKKFLYGLAFGAGFGIAMFVIWVGGSLVVLPTLLESKIVSTREATEEPVLSNPQRAEVEVPKSGAMLSTPDFSFYKRAERSEMKIPEGGGILAMTVLPTPADAERPRTFQLWLTETELWRIKTDGTTVEFEQGTYPTGDPVKEMNAIMGDLMRVGAGYSQTTVSWPMMAKLKRGEKCDDSSLNGELKMTPQGAVFVMPNEMKRYG